MWPKRLQILACVWGFVLVLSLIWLHIVAGPQLAPEAQQAVRPQPRSSKALREPAWQEAEEALPPTPTELGAEPEEGFEEQADPGEDSGLESAAATAGALAEQPPYRAERAEGNFRKTLQLGCKPEPPSEPPELESNAPRLPPREGDSETPSEMPKILPGADHRRQHGRLGLFPNGSCCRVSPLPLGRMSEKDRAEAHKGFAFNTRVSEATSVDRRQKDIRSVECKKVVFPCTLPAASVIITFHNEHLVTLLRSLHSVLNNAPPSLLTEVIVIDDASKIDTARFSAKHFARLQEELDEYCRALPKVKLVRLKERRGIMAARMEGAWRAVGEVLIFLDSHIEVTPGWLEPLLAHIKTQRKSVALPVTELISNENLKFDLSLAGVGPMSFTWNLMMHAFARPTDDGPADSPIVAGGHFAVDRVFFLHLGGYDLGMQLYSGEDMEMGFRTWMCGGSVRQIPCSHVGHIFRQPTLFQGQVYTVPAEVIQMNKYRTAQVWMDEYADVIKVTEPLPPKLQVGDLSARKALRHKLKCKKFSWYLAHVAKDVRVVTMKPPKWRLVLMNVMTAGCIDTLGETEAGKKIGCYPCHSKPSEKSTQAIQLNPHSGHMRLFRARHLCMASVGKKVTLEPCEDKEDEERKVSWKWKATLVPGIGRLRVDQTHCLVATAVVNAKSPFTLAVEPCSESIMQLWSWHE